MIQLIHTPQPVYQTNQGSNPPAQSIQATAPLSNSTSALSQDSVQTLGLKTGLRPTLAGGGSALLAGLAGNAASLAVISALRAIPGSLPWDSGALAILSLPMVSIPAAIVAGATTANLTEDKTKGAAYGAGIGAATAVAVDLLLAGSSAKVVSSLAIGAAFGAIGGLAGSTRGPQVPQIK